jgi:hypothetical protein
LIGLAAFWRTFGPGAFGGIEGNRFIDLRHGSA